MQVRKSLVRKRFTTVDTLGLVLRVLVTAANVGEREGGKQVLKWVQQSQDQVSRLTTIWVDGGNDYEPQIAMGDELLPVDCAGGSAPRTN